MSFDFPASRLLQVATGQEGQGEHPPNSNNTKYGAALGDDGQPWCSAFLWWCMLQCGRDIRKDLGLSGADIASVAALQRGAQRAGWWQAGYAGLMPGDAVVLDSTPWDGVRDHVRLVISAGTTTYRGVGGNESDAVRVGTHPVGRPIIGHIKFPYAAEKRPHGNARRVHVVAQGETLSGIAAAMYGDSGKWTVIYRANTHVIGPNPDHILPGERLIIP